MSSDSIFQFIHTWNQGGITVDNYDISLLQLPLFWKNTVNLKECVTTTTLLKYKKDH